MQAQLTFTLPEEEEDFFLATNAPQLAYVITELLADLRNKVKYKHEKHPEAAIVAYDDVRTIIGDLLRARDLERLL